MKATVFLIALTITLVSGQAPNDIDESCRTTHPYNPHHDWIPYVNETAVGIRGNVKWQVILDQYDYFNILGQSGAVWTAMDFDGDNLQFTQSDTTCTNTLEIPATSFENSNTNHWVFTQAVSYLDAVEVFVNSTFRFSGCVQRPACLKSYVTLYRFDTNSSLPSDDSEITNRDNYVPYLGDAVRSRLEQTTTSGSVEIVESFDRPNANRLYFGIQDTGSFGEITRIIIYYKVAQGYEEGLVICPSVGLPRNSSNDTNSGRCVCKSNASPLTDMTRICNGAGECQASPSCACNPGYEYDSTAMECRACPIGTYKAALSNAPCQACPGNSTTLRVNSTVCECLYGTVRNLSRPDDSCQALDEFIQNYVCSGNSNAPITGIASNTESNTAITIHAIRDLITITALAATLFGLKLFH